MACYTTPSPLEPPMLITPPTSPHRLPPIEHLANEDEIIGIKQVDWIGASHPNSRSSQIVAEKFCEMICYLWFASPQPTPSPPTTSYPSPENSPFATPAPCPATPLQMTTTPEFVRFVQKLLETTQVSQSVIVLSLHYIWKLKERNKYTLGQTGSEYRIAVVALMMANKFLDDNTYTNKTWSEVSKISLIQINTMESEFLAGVEFRLYVDKAVYDSWLYMLTGLVRAQERACASRRRGRHVAHARIASSVQKNYHNNTRIRSRARSISPVRAPVQIPTRLSSYALPPIQSQTPVMRLPPIQTSPHGHSPSKRTAAEAFSPTSIHPAAKRPLIAVQIPTYQPTQSQNHTQHCAPNGTLVNHSPIDLPSFGRMSIASACSSPHWATPSSSTSSSYSSSSPLSNSNSSSTSQSMPTPPPKGTLVTAYDYPATSATAAQNLYFYALAGSPERKGRLRYCQPGTTYPTQTQRQLAPYPSTHSNPISTLNLTPALTSNSYSSRRDSDDVNMISSHLSIEPKRFSPYQLHYTHPVGVQSARTSPAQSGGRYYTPSLPPIQYLQQYITNPPVQQPQQRFYDPVWAAVTDDINSVDGVKEGVYANAGPPGVRGRGGY